MTKSSRCAAAPCKSCPYRKDVPSGVWAPEEYAKLPGYDGDTMEQLMAGRLQMFDCHQQNGKLCAGWVGCHDMTQNLAVRMNADHVDPMIFDYVSPVPLFASGADAAAHGMADVQAPSPEAIKVVSRLERKRTRRR